MDGELRNDLLDKLRDVRRQVVDNGAAMVARWDPMLSRGAFKDSAVNLSHYLALRQLDLRPLQADLAPLGLASLGHCEGHVLPSLDAIIANMEMMRGHDMPETRRPSADEYYAGRKLLEKNSATVFGPRPTGRETRILVTLAPKTAANPEALRGLFDAGMDCARINCGRDSVAQWSMMIDNVQAMSAEVGRKCPVLVDLAGPKIRTDIVVTPKKTKKVQAGDKILLAFDTPDTGNGFSFQANCAMPEVLRQIKAGANVSIRDGLISGTVEEIRDDGVVMAVVRTPPGGYPLQEKRGINFPGSAVVVPPLTDKDLKDLDFVAERADGVAYSFVQRPEDIAWLQDELDKRRPGQCPMPIIAKIETGLAFSNLPELIVQAAGANPFGVMIARGDLAVEIGYERLSEVQEEILWLCDAAHVPVIWATQVLESLVKRGMPSRGEFTDAAMAERAECVMLNKGAYIGEGVAVLDNVLTRMESHNRNRSRQLRPLRAWARAD